MSQGCTASLQHLLAELRRIDLLLRQRVIWAQQEGRAAADEFRGLYITEEEIATILANPAHLGLGDIQASHAAPGGGDLADLIRQQGEEIAHLQAVASAQGIELRLPRLVNLFRLTPLERDALLISLAPETDLRYERLYAYLQDDVTKKRPSVSLVLNLLCPSLETRLAARRHFAAEAPLRAWHLLYLYDDPSTRHPPLLAKVLKVDGRVVEYLLGGDEIDNQLIRFVRWGEPGISLEDVVLPQSTRERLLALARHAQDEAYRSSQSLEVGSKTFCFQGPQGVGKRTTAQALCRELGLPLLIVDLPRLLADELPPDMAVSLVFREALLQKAALYWHSVDALEGEEQNLSLCREALARGLCRHPGLTILGGEATQELLSWLRPETNGTHHGPTVTRVDFPVPSYGERKQLWQMALEHQTASAGIDPGVLASKFRLTGAQISQAVAMARGLAFWHSPGDGHITLEDLYTACREQSAQRLTALAHKVTPRRCWEDIVLPKDRLAQLREICSYVKYRHIVYDEWGFDRKLSLGKGLNILFAGPSGTGKTMAAEIMAGELGLELYKIDLSTVVSKYIGETEKNLDRIFREAVDANAILFFDEADAIFGKRSEVRDSHDRYANIEIAYLLQKMEVYDGMVILATNLRKNMDEAFVRRMHFAVEFPFPEEPDRLEIWRRIFPPEAPLGEDVDLSFLARHFKIAGGNIRNIALAAAFLTAEDGHAITMPHLILATKREYQKMGKLCTEANFGQYFELIKG